MTGRTIGVNCGVVIARKKFKGQPTFTAFQRDHTSRAGNKGLSAAYEPFGKSPLKDKQKWGAKAHWRRKYGGKKQGRYQSRKSFSAVANSY